MLLLTTSLDMTGAWMSMRGAQEGACLVAQSCLCDPMDCSPPGSSVHGILQARILERVAISFFRGSSWPKDWTSISCISCIAGRFFTCWTRRWMHRIFDNSLHATEQLNGSWFFCCCCFFLNGYLFYLLLLTGLRVCFGAQPLCCCTKTFSICSKQGLLSSCGG